MEKIPGKPLRWSIASPEQRLKVMSQLADIYIELRGHPFDLLGSFDNPGTDHIGPFARESLTDYINSQMRPIGPFAIYKEYLVASIELTLDLIMRGECYANRVVDAFLIHRFLLDCVPQILQLSNKHSLNDGGKFYLTHADTKGDQILVDDAYNITGVIDWEWAHTSPSSIGFNSPIMLLPVADFYDGMNQLGEDELVFVKLLESKGHSDLADIVKGGRVIHYFEFCCGYDLEDWEGFLGLFKGLRVVLGGDADLDWDGWKEKALIEYKGDGRLEELMGTCSEV